MLLHALTIFLGAFLLFLIQPLLGKSLLPWFGGGPGVWTACLLFFQIGLLAGYAYAHGIATRLRPRTQAIVHGLLLAGSLAFLPVAPHLAGPPADGAAPTLRILLLLGATIGWPFVVLAATGPLLQRWFVQAQPATSVYRLYALSNAGSLLALVGYPFVVEPLCSLQVQASVWSGGMVVFVVLCGWCAVRVWKVDKTQPPGLKENITWGRLAWWVALPALASGLLAAITNKLTQEVAPVPFLWVLPLVVYLVSFIVCFEHPRWYSRRVCAGGLAAGGCAVLYLLHAGINVSMNVQLWVYPAVLFAACMLGHGEVYRLRPPPAQLTRFYLCVATGGVLGSVGVAVLAPHFFHDYYEVQIGICALVAVVGLLSVEHRNRSLPLALAVGAVLGILIVPGLAAASREEGGGFGSAYGRQFMAMASAYGWVAVGAAGMFALCFRDGWRRPLAREWRWGMPVFAAALAVVLAVGFYQVARQGRREVVVASRNFYGTVQVKEFAKDNPQVRHLELMHGLTSHGAQFHAPERARWPTTYYGHNSGVGVALDLLKTGKLRRVGVVGLGAGTLASYGRRGDRFTFYEINPTVIELAQAPFTFLSASEATVDVVPGDARLALVAQAARGELKNFDVLVLDAFTGDAIPTHLLTAEAVAVYCQHLKPEGLIAVHISNRYLDLRGVLVGLARKFAMDFVVVDESPKIEEYWVTKSRWVLLTRSKHLLSRWLPADPAARKALEENYRPVLWTDDHASLLSVLQRDKK